mgnify:CR=1 FL=1
MKNTLTILLLVFTTSLLAQKKNYFVKKGAVARGYDVVAYFDNQAKEGSKEFSVEHDGVNFYFSSQQNLNTFKKNPSKYIPQYGGFCAYAMGAKGSKVPVNPETFEIRDGKLYLFYNKGRTNTLNYWIEQGAEQLKEKADQNWEKITKKS